MEYVNYFLIILAIMALCLLALLRNRSLEVQATKSNKAADPVREALGLNREALNAPIPWGWPGHDGQVTDKSNATQNAQEAHGVSESLHRFADRLLSEKQTIENREYLLKKDASLRALLEDRYGRAYTAPQDNFRNAQVPLLRDPGKPLVTKPLHEVKTPWGW